MHSAATIIKIRLIFLCIIALFIMVSAFSFNRMFVLNQKSTEMEISWLPSIVWINAIVAKIDDYRIAELLHILSLTPEEIEQQEKEIERITQELTSLRKRYEVLISSNNELELYQNFTLKYEEYLRECQEALEYSKRNEKEAATNQLKKSSILFNSLKTELEKLVKLNQEGGEETSRGGDEIFEQVKTVLIAINVVIGIIIFIFMFLVESWSSRIANETKFDEQDDKKATASFINRITIKNKLRSAFLGLSILFMIFTGLSLNRMDLINQKSTEIEESWLPAVIAINATNTATSDLHTALFRLANAIDSNEAMKQEKEIQNQRNFIAEQLRKYEPTIDTEEERAIQQEFSRKYDEYLAAVEKIITIINQEVAKSPTTIEQQENTQENTIEPTQQKNSDLITQLDRADVLFNDMSIDLLKLVDFNNAGAKNTSHEGDSLYELSFSILVGTSACVFVLAILLMIWFEKIVSSPLNRLTAIVREVAKGNVIITKEYYDRYDEIGYIAKAIGNITQTLDALIKDSSELINAAQMGALSTRVDTTRHPGEFGALVVGMNQLLTVLSKPLIEVAEVMQQLALGNLNKRIEGAYEGDLRALKANVNRSLDSLIALLTELGDITKNMSAGDLTHHIEGSYQGDFASLKTNTNQSLKQMKEILTIVVGNTEHIASASTQTLAAAEHVSTQSSKQMAALDEVAAAVTQTSMAVAQIAENTMKSGKLASATAELAATGRAQLIKLIEIIEKISDEYKRIEQITTKINRIADKTHLLSLNAGLEAVRAGEHGLGFGFVAQQIGKLAEEASFSARDIGTLITNSSQSVTLSVNTAQQTRIAVEDIAKAAQESGSAVEFISSAITQQSASVEWISEQVSKIQTGGQENAAAAEEISATMLKLADTIKETHTQVQRFKLA